MPNGTGTTEGEEGGSKTQANDRKSRAAFGDVSNRRRNRAQAVASRAEAEETRDKPARRRSARLRSRSIDQGDSEHAGDSRKVAALPTNVDKDDEKKDAKEVPKEQQSVPTQSTMTSLVEGGKEQQSVNQCQQTEPVTADPQLKRSLSDVTEQEETTRKRSRHLVTEPDRKPLARSNPKRASSQLKPRQLSSDFYLEANHNLVRFPFDPSVFTAGLSVYDSCSRGRVLECPEYVADIFQRLYHAETQEHPRPYMHRQPNLNTNMRAILVDWLVEVHTKFRLFPETLYLCVSIVDRYLAAAEISRAELQLVGVAALWIASKYEEVYPPEVKDCVYMTDRAYTVQEVLNMELKILRQLHFKLAVPTAFPFINRFLFIVKASPTMRLAAYYYSERVLQEHDFLKFRPSVVAAAAVCLAWNHPGIRAYDSFVGENGIPEVLLTYTGYDEATILDAAKLMARKIQEEVVTQTMRALVSVKQKFCSPRYLYISNDFDVPHVEDITSA